MSITQTITARPEFPTLVIGIALVTLILYACARSAHGEMKRRKAAESLLIKTLVELKDAPGELIGDIGAMTEMNLDIRKDEYEGLSDSFVKDTVDHNRRALLTSRAAHDRATALEELNTSNTAAHDARADAIHSANASSDAMVNRFDEIQDSLQLIDQRTVSLRSDLSELSSVQGVMFEISQQVELLEAEVQGMMS